MDDGCSAMHCKTMHAVLSYTTKVKNKLISWQKTLYAE